MKRIRVDKILNTNEVRQLANLLRRLNEECILIPQQIIEKADRIYKFCNQELEDNGQEHIFALGTKEVTIQSQPAEHETWDDTTYFSRSILVDYVLKWKANWYSTYHNSDERFEDCAIEYNYDLGFGFNGKHKMRFKGIKEEK